VGSQRRPYVHEARLRLAEQADPDAVGAAVTIELCGSIDHAGGCRWPHNSTVVELDGADAVFRSVFVAPPAESEEVHDRIARALRSSDQWVVVSDGERPVSDDEEALGVRLARTSPPSGQSPT
jgi:hypothetical protein